MAGDGIFWSGQWYRFSPAPKVKEYIHHHLAIAGRTDPLFTDDVITEIYHHAKGLPRVINTLCYDCLWEIYELQKSLVDLPTLERVLCRYDEG